MKRRADLNPSLHPHRHRIGFLRDAGARQHAKMTRTHLARSSPMRTFTQNEPADRRRTRPPRRLPQKLQGRQGDERRATRRVLRRPHRGTGDRDAERILTGGLRRRDVGRLRVRQPRRSERNLGTDDAALEHHRRDAVTRARSTCRSCCRTRTAWLTATTGLTGSCGA